MTCVNWITTILAAIIFAAAVWPGISGGVGGLAAWIIGISAVIIVALSWTGVECKMCAAKPKKA